MTNRSPFERWRTMSFLINYATHITEAYHCSTCLGQHCPGNEWDQQTTKFPEDKQPAEVLAAICLAQEFTAIRKHNGQQPADSVRGKKWCESQQPAFFKTSVLYFVNVMRFVSAEVMYDACRVFLMPKSEISFMVCLRDHYVGHELCVREWW